MAATSGGPRKGLLTVVCGKCDGVGTVRRHGEPDDEACPMCGGRGVMIVTEQQALDTAAQVVTPREETRALLVALRERLHEGLAYQAHLVPLMAQLEAHASENVRDMGHEGIRRAGSCIEGVLEALREAILHIRQAEQWDNEGRG